MRRRKPAKDRIPQPMVHSDETNSVVATNGSLHGNVSLNEKGSVKGHEPVATPESTSHWGGRTGEAPETLDVVTDDTVAAPTSAGRVWDASETTREPDTDGAAEAEEEPRGAHAKREGLVIPDDQRGAHLKNGDPLLSVEGRALHARKG